MEKLFSDIIEELYKSCLNNIATIRKDYGLTISEYNLIIIFDPNDSLSCKEISVRLNLSLSRTSRIVDKLVTKRILHRTEGKIDRRYCIISLTEKGVLISKKINTDRYKCEKKIIEKIGNKQFQNLKNRLAELSHRLSLAGH